MFLKKTRINIQEIIEEYYASIRNSHGKISRIDKKTFFYFPAITAIVAAFLGDITKDYIILIVTIMSIISGLLLNMLLLLTAEAKRVPDNHPDPEIRKQLIRETFSVISYTILLSVFIIAVLSVFYFIDPEKWHFSIKDFSFSINNFPVFISCVRFLYSFMAIGIIVHVFVNVILIVRRIHKFFSFEIK